MTRKARRVREIFIVERSTLLAAAVARAPTWQQIDYLRRTAHALQLHVDNDPRRPLVPYDYPIERLRRDVAGTVLSDGDDGMLLVALRAVALQERISDASTFLALARAERSGLVSFGLVAMEHGGALVATALTAEGRALLVAHGWEFPPCS